MTRGWSSTHGQGSWRAATALFGLPYLHLTGQVTFQHLLDPSRDSLESALPSMDSIYKSFLILHAA